MSGKASYLFVLISAATQACECCVVADWINLWTENGC